MIDLFLFRSSASLIFLIAWIWVGMGYQYPARRLLEEPALIFAVLILFLCFVVTYARANAFVRRRLPRNIYKIANLLQLAIGLISICSVVWIFDFSGDSRQFYGISTLALAAVFEVARTRWLAGFIVGHESKRRDL